MANHLSSLKKVQKLQAALHVKAKESVNYRFYALYDKIYRPDVLAVAWQQCRHNGGAAGVDQQTFADIEAQGVEAWLIEVAQELRTKEYQPQPVRRVFIKKPDGGRRPLGIPTIKDRVVQTAVALILGPIFDEDLFPEQYAYRPQKSAHDAVDHVRRLLCRGYTEVVDADLSSYFDTIPHAELLRSLARRISDGRILHLLKMWMTAPVEIRQQGTVQRTTCSKDQGRGTPQGAPVSPLLANVYMRRFILCWKHYGYEQKYGAFIVNYADDFVICCRPGTAPAVMAAMRELMERLRLTVNETKTKLCRVPADTLDFLGYYFGTCMSYKRMKEYLGTWPSPAAEKDIRQRISDLTGRNTLGKSSQVSAVGRIILTWDR